MLAMAIITNIYNKKSYFLGIYLPYKGLIWLIYVKHLLHENMNPPVRDLRLSKSENLRESNSFTQDKNISYKTSIL